MLYERLYANEILGGKDGRGFARPPKFVDGLNNLPASHPLFALPIPAPYLSHATFDDFDRFAAAEYVITKIGTGTTALAAGDGGRLLITNTAGGTDSIFLQSLVAGFRMAVGKPAFFEAKLQVSNATLSTLVCGLQAADTTPLAVSDGIFFLKNTAAALIDFSVYGASAGTTAAGIATLVAATDTKFQWFYNGADKVFYGINDIVLGSVASTNLPTAVDLAVSFGVGNGDAVARTMNVDYVFASKLR